MFGNRNFRDTMVNTPVQDGFIDIDNNSGKIDIDFMQNANNASNSSITTQGAVMEPGTERVVHRTFEHIVPHVCPIRTRIVNHHVYRHVYRPEFTCCEENVCENIQDGSCCNF